jgi:hypothetical protein
MKKIPAGHTGGVSIHNNPRRYQPAVPAGAGVGGVAGCFLGYLLLFLVVLVLVALGAAAVLAAAGAAAGAICAVPAGAACGAAPWASTELESTTPATSNEAIASLRIMMLSLDDLGIANPAGTRQLGWRDEPTIAARREYDA